MFDELIRSARAAEQGGGAELTLRLLRQAVDLYEGQFLPDVSFDWAQVQREWLRSGMLYAMERLAEAELRAGDHLSVIDRCCRMLEIEPFREETYRMLMRSHAELGQLAQARRWYRLCASRLCKELQIKPSIATQRLYHGVMRGELM
ncbi:BTAD domain-containing putative transcriptional regulator [Spongiactinospora sp. 9N601]|uniref:AfsR/SARP family transcriptional regulator n=1 Tax=Spongiactinospora sp. 9N601 TaxID=3375149 RepID=UPI0037A5D856